MHSRDFDQHTYQSLWNNKDFTKEALIQMTPEYSARNKRGGGRTTTLEKETAFVKAHISI